MRNAGELWKRGSTYAVRNPLNVGFVMDSGCTVLEKEVMLRI
jgi:hypothetical protein